MKLITGMKSGINEIKKKLLTSEVNSFFFHLAINRLLDHQFFKGTLLTQINSYKINSFGQFGNIEFS